MTPEIVFTQAPLFISAENPGSTPDKFLVITGTGNTMGFRTGAELKADIGAGSGEGGGGNVNSGASSSIHGEVVLFSGTTGLNIYSSGITIDADINLTSDSNLKLSTQRAVKTYIDNNTSGINYGRMYVFANNYITI